MLTKTNIELGAYMILEGIGGLNGKTHGAGTAERGYEARVDNAQEVLSNCFGDNTPPPADDQ